MELKKAIIMWLLENYKAFNCLNECVNEFRAYIYDKSGNYLIGGEAVAKFINEQHKLLSSEL